MKARHPEQRNKKVISLRVLPEVDACLEALAKKTGRTKSYFMQEAIEEYLEACKDGPPTAGREAVML